jgi:plastocyanin
MTRRLATLIPFAAALAIAGCGSSSSSSSSPPASSSNGAVPSGGSSGGGGRVTLSETEFKITPAAPTVADTGTITITVKNSGAITHALAVQTPSGVVKTGPIPSGSTATLKVDAAKAGRYTFFCPIDHHRASGMQGVLVVGSAAASSSGAPAPATSTSSSSSGGGYGY